MNTEQFINYAITNNLTVQKLSSYLLSHKELDNTAVTEILNSYIHYLTVTINTINNHFKLH